MKCNIRLFQLARRRTTTEMTTPEGMVQCGDSIYECFPGKGVSAA